MLSGDRADAGILARSVWAKHGTIVGVEAHEYDDNWATCARTYASLRIFKSDLDPNAVEKLLGLEATDSYRTGDRVGSQGGHRTNGAWILSTESTVVSKDLRRHIDWLLDRIDPRAMEFDELAGTGVEADIFCYWESATGHGGPGLSPPQMERLVRRNLPVGVDVYFPESRNSVPLSD